MSESFTKLANSDHTPTKPVSESEEGEQYVNHIGYFIITNS